MRILFFLLFPIFLSAQINRAYGVIEIGSTFPSSSATGPKFAYRPVDSSFYRWIHTNVWVKVVEPSITPDTLYLTQISGTTAIVNGDTINLTPYLLKTDTTSMLAAYIKLVGYGIIKTGQTIRADTTSPNGLATRLFAKTLPTIIATGYVATSNGTNLVARNLFDNNTYVGVLNSKPWQFGQWTTAGRPAGTTGYTGFNTSNNYPEFYNGSAWDEIFTPWQRGSAYTFYGADLASTRWDLQVSGTQTVGLGLIKDSDYYGMEVGESATKTGGLYWRNGLERVDFTTNGNTYPIAFGNNWMYLAPTGRTGFGNTNPQRTIDVTGEVRITDLTTDAPIRLVGADNDGDLGSTATGNGLAITNSELLSSTGITWNTTAITGSPSLIGICYGNNRFVACSFNGKIFTSTDGRSWMERTAPAANQWSSVAYGNGIFVAVSYNGTNRVATSNDGITWTARSAAEANQWLNVTYGNNQFVAVSDNGTNRVMTSPDGITWTARSAVSSNWHRVIYANGLYVAVAYGGTDRVMTSPDGITWTGRTAAAANQWRGVTFANNLFVAVSSDGTNRVMTSPDATTWTIRTLASGTWYDVTFGNGLFVACDNAGGVATSPDGITWTIRVGGGGRTIIYEEGMFVSAFFGGSITSSGSKTIRQPYNNITNGDWIYNGNLVVGNGIISRKTTYAANQGAYYSMSSQSSSGWLGGLYLSNLLGSGLNFESAYEIYRNAERERYVSQHYILDPKTSFTENYLSASLDTAIVPGSSWAFIRLGTKTNTIPKSLWFTSAGSTSIDTTHFRFNNVNGLGVATGKFLSVEDAGTNLFVIRKNGTIDFSKYGTNTKTAAALGKTFSTLTGFATDGTVLNVEQKRDTTIYVTDADYDFSAAITTAQIARRYNRVIFWMTTTGAAGSDSELTLHTPDANLMQVEYLIHSVDEPAGFDNKIVFGTNNAVDSTNGLVTNYYPAAGDGIHIRAGLRSGVYKYRYSN